MSRFGVVESVQGPLRLPRGSHVYSGAGSTVCLRCIACTMAGSRTSTLAVGSLAFAALIVLALFALGDNRKHAEQAAGDSCWAASWRSAPTASRTGLALQLLAIRLVGSPPR